MVSEAGANWLQVTIRLLAFAFFGLVLPQVLGLVGYRWSRHKGKLLKVATLLIPPVVFFVGAYLFWGLSAEAVRDSGNYVCGAFGAAAVFSTIFGTLINLIIGVILFLCQLYMQKREAAQPQAGH